MRRRGRRRGGEGDGGGGDVGGGDDGDGGGGEGDGGGARAVEAKVSRLSHLRNLTRRGSATAASTLPQRPTFAAVALNQRVVIKLPPQVLLKRSGHRKATSADA